MLRASLNCLTTLIKILQFEERGFFMTIYFNIIITGILDYLQKYYKMAWLKNKFDTRICTIFAMTSQQFLTD